MRLASADTSWRRSPTTVRRRDGSSTTMSMSRWAARSRTRSTASAASEPDGHHLRSGPAVLLQPRQLEQVLHDARHPGSTRRPSSAPGGSSSAGSSSSSRVSASRTSAPTGVRSSWLMLATKSVRIASRRDRSLTSSIRRWRRRRRSASHRQGPHHDGAAGRAVEVEGLGRSARRARAAAQVRAEQPPPPARRRSARRGSARRGRCAAARARRGRRRRTPSGSASTADLQLVHAAPRGPRHRPRARPRPARSAWRAASSRASRRVGLARVEAAGQRRARGAPTTARRTSDRATAAATDGGHERRRPPPSRSDLGGVARRCRSGPWTSGSGLGSSPVAAYCTHSPMLTAWSPMRS